MLLQTLKVIDTDCESSSNPKITIKPRSTNINPSSGESSRLVELDQEEFRLRLQLIHNIWERALDVNTADYDFWNYIEGLVDNTELVDNIRTAIKIALEHPELVIFAIANVDLWDIALSAEKGTNEELETLLLQELEVYGTDFTLIANAEIFEDILNLIRALRSPRPLTQEQQNLLLTIVSMPAITFPAYRLFSMKNFDITLGLLPIIPRFAAASILEHMMLRDFFGEVVYKYHRTYFTEGTEELHSASVEIPTWFQPLKGTEFTVSLGSLFANSNGIIFIDPHKSVEHLAFVLTHEQLHRIHRRVRFIGKNKRKERIGFAELGISERLLYSMEEYITEAFSLLLVTKGDIREALNLANMFASNRYAQGAKRFLELLRDIVQPEKSVDALKFVLESYQAVANGEVEYAWDLLRNKYEEKCRASTNKDCSFYAEFPSLMPSVGSSIIPANFLGIYHLVKWVLDSMYNLDSNFVEQYLERHGGFLIPGMKIDHNGFKKAIGSIGRTVAFTSPPDRVEEALGQTEVYAELYNYAMRVATIMLNLAVSHKDAIKQVISFSQ